MLYEIEECADKNHNLIKETQINKKYKHHKTDRISLSSCQPLSKYTERGKGNRQNLDIDNNIGCCYRCNSIQHQQLKKQKELMKMLSWLSEEDYDYIHSERAQNLSEVEIFIDVMLSSRIPIQMTFKVNSPTDINIVYQLLPKFKDEFMILNSSKTHCMVMRAF